MNSIISVLVAYNQFLLLQIHQLLVFIAKNIPLKSPKYDVTSPKYNKHTVDKLPVIKKMEQLNYILLLEEYRAKHGKNLPPVKSRGGTPVPPNCTCPRCGAPHTYIYDNNGGRGQLLCKICNLCFDKGKKILNLLLCFALTVGMPLSKRRIVSISTSTSVSIRTVPST